MIEFIDLRPVGVITKASPGKHDPSCWTIVPFCDHFKQNPVVETLTHVEVERISKFWVAAKISIAERTISFIFGSDNNKNIQIWA